MKRFHFRTGLIFASWAMLLIFGCHKKKPPIPTQEPPPEISTSKPQEQQPTTTTTQQPAQNPTPTETTTNNPPEKPTPKRPKRPATQPPKKSAPEPEKPTEVAKNTPPPPPRVVIQEGGSNADGSGKVSGTSDNSISQATTQQLIDVAEANLRSIKRQLSSEEQTHVAEIRDYIKQSKDATKDGDLARAHNLASKARLLSDDLVKTK